MALQVSPCRTRLSCSRSTWPVVMAHLHSQGAALSTYCYSQTSLQGRSTSFPRVSPTGYARRRSYALCATIVAAHDYVRYCKLNRACKLLRAVRLVPIGGERQHRSAGYVFIGALNVSTPNRVIKRSFGRSRGSGNLGGTHAGQIRRNRFSVITRYSQFAQRFRGGRDIH